MNTPFALCMSFLHVQMICITDLYDCVNPYTVIFLYVLYVYDMFHILSLRDPWNVCICMYVCNPSLYEISNSPLVIIIKVKAKHKFHATVMFFNNNCVLQNLLPSMTSMIL